MSQEHDRSGRDLEDCGLRWDAAKQSVVWEETLSYDPDSEFCRAIDAKIAALDEMFLKSCGILAEDL